MGRVVTRKMEVAATGFRIGTRRRAVDDRSPPPATALPAGKVRPAKASMELLASYHVARDPKPVSSCPLLRTHNTSIHHRHPPPTLRKLILTLYTHPCLRSRCTRSGRLRRASHSKQLSARTPSSISAHFSFWVPSSSPACSA